MERKRYIGPWSILVFCALLLAACGATSHTAEFAPDFVARQGAAVRVGVVEDAVPVAQKGDRAGFDFANELRLQLLSHLENAGLTPATDADPAYTLNATIVHYQPGNAFSRWLMPGAGATVLSVEATLYDGETEVAHVNALRSISAGGGYTIGAWRTIFDTVAQDVVEELKPKLGGGAA